MISTGELVRVCAHAVSYSGCILRVWSRDVTVQYLILLVSYVAACNKCGCPEFRMLLEDGTGVATMKCRFNFRFGLTGGESVEFKPYLPPKLSSKSKSPFKVHTILKQK
jgi:hypothetical protein